MLGRIHAAAIIAASALLAPLPTSAQEVTDAANAEAAQQVVVESYYRIKWGSDGEFMSLYRKNHLPILEEAKARGIIKDLRIDIPYNHMVGGARWDLRVTATYRDASAALLKDPVFIEVFDAVQAGLKKANARFDDEEARRFTLLEEHWDVILLPD